MANQKCTCGEKPGGVCPVCGERELPGYWCDVCERAVADKRCPLCGLKTRKLRAKGGKEQGK